MSKYNKNKIENLVKTSFFWSEVCRKAGIKERGGSQSYLKSLAVKFKVDFTHFKGCAWNKGTQYSLKKIDYYLNNEGFINSHNLKKRLIKEGLKANECEICLLSLWQGTKIPIELDHIDGNHKNNNLNNLRILCPNCHAQTENYCGLNIKEKREKKVRQAKVIHINSICNCGNKKTQRARTCGLCREIKTKIVWPKKDILINLLKSSNYTQVGKMLGVSDNAIRKHLKRYKT